MFSPRKASLSLILTLTAFTAVTHADLPIARLNAVTPPGGQRGQAVEIALDGSDLEGVQQLQISRNGLTSEHLGDNRFRIQIPADTPLGPVDIRAIGTWGISNPRSFLISDLPQVAEAEPNNLIEQSQKVTLGTSIYGTIGGRGDVDYFAFPLEKGQSIVVECFGQRIDSLLDGVLTLFGPDGKALVLSDRYTGKDPRLDFTAPEAGEYKVRLHDLVFNGGGSYFYRLNIDNGPVVDYVFPPVVTAGKAADVEIFGRNLPNGKPAEGVSAFGQPLEVVSFHVEPPPVEKSSVLSAESFLEPRRARVDGFPVHFDRSQPVIVDTTTDPVVLETEPNDAPASAQVVTLPSEVVGRCEKPGASDWYRFSAKKGEVVEIEGVSEQAGFPADLTLLVQRIVSTNAETGKVETADIGEFDDDGQSVGGLSYITSTHDPLARITIPEDGDYVVEVRDRFAESRGDGRFVYRLRLSHPKPDFRLLIAPSDPSNPSSLLVRQGGTTEAVVYVLRDGGFAGEVHVRVEGLPQGVSAQPITIGPGMTEGGVVFQAAADAPDFSGTVEIVGTAKIGDQDVEHPARSAAIIWPAGGNAPRHARLTQNIGLAVRPNAPYLLTAEPSKWKIGQGAMVNLPLKLERRWEEFKDKLTGVTAVHLPGAADNATIEIPGADGTLPLYFKPELAPGTYTFLVKGSGKVPFTKTPDDPMAKKAPVDVAEPSTPIEITVVPRPAEIKIEPATPTAKPGELVQLKLVVQRHNGYTGAVKVSVTPPAAMGELEAPEITIPADVSETILPIQVSSGAAAGDKGGLAVRGFANVNSEPIPVDTRFVLKVAN